MTWVVAGTLAALIVWRTGKLFSVLRERRAEK